MTIDQAQVVPGELVLDESENEQARSVAKRMAEEHSRSLDASIDLAEDHGVAPVEEPGPVETWGLERPSQLSGPAFDLEPLNSQVVVHCDKNKRLGLTVHNRRDGAVRAAADRGQGGARRTTMLRTASC